MVDLDDVSPINPVPPLRRSRKPGPRRRPAPDSKGRERPHRDKVPGESDPGESHIDEYA
jgi:hypothetical protein